ncbi:glucose-dependent insulinotropic receptor-like [Schistocerca gregaria]|uniref:glucose-dependent insulinotropic receptor-like n=1 Tax=Schistocerca gregaria TaxID=7010 RepID=UPI00211DE7CD|nr:glucose-dependent insulinotropic receptor-like [Schistocerca gregaria]
MQSPMENLWDRMHHSPSTAVATDSYLTSVMSLAGMLEQYTTSSSFMDLTQNISVLANNSVSTDQSLNITIVKSATTQLLIYDYLIPAIGALIIILNLAVVVSSGLIIRSGVQPKTTYLFLGNIAMADLITGIAVVFGQAFPKNLRDETTCFFQLGMILSSTLSSVWSVGLIAVDRFLYIGYGLQYQRWLYPRRARLLIASTWVLGIVVGFLPAFGWSGNTNNGRVCWFIRMPAGLVLLVTYLGIIPVITVIILYSIILYRALKKVRQLQRADEEANTNGSTQNQRSPKNNAKNMRIFRGGMSTQMEPKSKPKKAKAVKVVLFTTGSFVITWVPYFVACVMYLLCKDEKTCKTLSVIIAAPLAILGFLNSLINPVIYAWWHNGFRTFLRKKVNQLQKYRSDRSNKSSTTGSRSTRTTSGRSSGKSSACRNSGSRETGALAPMEASRDETHL